MFRNYLLVALRNLKRNRVYSFINIAGLSIGLACCMLIVLYLMDEVSFDKFHKQGTQIFRLTRDEYQPDGKIFSTDGNTGMMPGPAFASEVPEIASFVRIQGERTAVKIGNNIFEQEGMYADSNFFSVFTFPLKAGNPATALSKMYSVVLSEDVAKKFFGSTDVLGKMIELPQGEDRSFQSFEVTGIVPRSPQNSSIRIDMVLPMSLNEREGRRDNQWINFYLNTFFVLNKGADIIKVEAKMKEVYEKQAKEQITEAREKYNFKNSMVYRLQGLHDMHLSTTYGAYNGLTGASKPIYSKILGGIALFILIIACINFVNLTMARSLKRAKEIGIRKVVGGERKQLITQFMGESMLLSFCSFVLAILLVITVLPFFNTLSNKALSFSYLLDAKLIGGYIALFLFTSILAGFYPALVLSGYDPVETLYNRTRFSGKNYLSKGLVIIQFALAAFLMVATITIYTQFNFLTSQPLGYNDKNIVIVDTDGMKADKLSIFKSELQKDPSIESVAARQGGFWSTIAKTDGKDIEFTLQVFDTAYLSTYQIPLVMGAVAFIMAETINVPYIDIVKAALIPAILYFVTAFWMVHLEAGSKGLLGLPKDECPNPWTAVRERWYLLLPLMGLVALLFSGYTPLFSGSVGLGLTVILIFGAAVISGVRATALRGLAWVLLGFACAGFFQFGVGTFFVVSALLVALTFILRRGGDARALALKALVDGARHALPVAIACALVGVIIGVINLTGVAAELGGHIIAIGRESLFLALLLTMITCLVLGMGIPTIPNYIITSSLAAPVLLELGVPLIVSHMFVFYFGIMADLTPPVALACFAAAPIARESGLKISVQAIRVAIAGFIVPFMAVYSPALMLQTGDWMDTTWIIFKALVAIAMWGAGAIGFLFGTMNWWERFVAIVSASFLIVALPLTDEIGLAAVALLVAWHFWRTRQQRAMANVR